jgi:DNA-binding transcriptional regulator YdaS (Cro superfamily)
MNAINELATYLSDREKVEPGQQTRLAEHLGVSPGLVWQWLNGRTPIAPKHARGIEAYTHGHVTRYVICPEIFGPAPDIPPALPVADDARRVTDILDEVSQFLTDDEREGLYAAIARGQEAADGYLRGLEQRPDLRAAINQVLIALGHREGHAPSAPS